MKLELCICERALTACERARAERVSACKQGQCPESRRTRKNAEHRVLSACRKGLALKALRSQGAKEALSSTALLVRHEALSRSAAGSSDAGAKSGSRRQCTAECLGEQEGRHGLIDNVGGK